MLATIPMTIDFESSVITFNIIVVLIGLYLAFFKSYFKEKGKQLAVKEDIEEITEKVERIKSEFTKETEQIKASLSLISQHKFSLASEERNAILNFYEKYSYWLNLIMETSPSSLTREALHKAEEFQQAMDEAKFDVDNAESRVNLFVMDEAFANIKKDLKFETLKLQHHVERSITSQYRILHEHNQMFKTTPAEDQVAKNKEFLDKRSEGLKEFREKLLEHYKLVIEEEKKIRLFIKDRLYSILNEKSE